MTQLSLAAASSRLGRSSYCNRNAAESSTVAIRAADQASSLPFPGGADDWHTRERGFEHGGLPRAVYDYLRTLGDVGEQVRPLSTHTSCRR